MSRYQRTHDGSEQKTTTLELFYDLVFVFAITQVSHFLLEHLTWQGAGQAALVLLVVWWSWNYTTWVTNELDPEAIAVRLLLIGLMLASFLMAIAIPEAFGDRALLFAGAYVTIQIGRHTFLTFVAAGPGTVERERSKRILIWFVVAAVFWIAGGLADGSLRTALWLIGLAIDYGGPLCTFWVPGMKRIPPSAWELEVSHFAERFQLFVILALGESIVVTGATASKEDLSAERLASFAVAFLGTAAMWWVYFNAAAAVAQRRLELATNRTTLARDGYTYLHVLMVAGIIVSAVGDELVIAHPGEVLHGAEVVAVVAGPAIYLLALVLFRLRMAGTLSVKRTLGAAGCIVAGFVGTTVSALALGALVVAILVAVITAETVTGAHRRARGEPSPLEAVG
ncbi:low temperature requirement protein A [Solirubrobacter ginsenosidimutans]|uniref:Low temperature requirement protein A n=1 Tax=Solirubrobacter ginsenosidimutans TaxID=490573 RepID=A0A9X3N2C4_9ACTN|nr:low temperature requirement protein A [Solirubrobacter ginsenosidimutans]MDA0167110.1 low temperature requirement protein A [Solirubrobacter ginsenosidimutans]